MLGYIAAAIGGSLLSTAMTNRANRSNTRENNALQERLSRTSHQREVKDLRAAGLNPILSAKGAGAPQPSTAASKVEPYKPDVGQAVIQAEQIKLLEAQSRKTRAEAVNTELMEPYNRALSNVYGSVLGEPAVGMKTLGTAGSAFGVYQGGKALHRMLKRRKSKVLPESKPLTNLQKQKLRKLHKLKTGSRNRYGLRRGEYINQKTGEILSRPKSGGGFSLRRGFGNRSGRYSKFNKF